MLSTTVEHQTAYYTLSLFFWHEMLFKHLVLRFSSYLQIFMVIYIFPFLKLFFPSELLQRPTLNHIAEQMRLLSGLSLIKPFRTFLSQYLLKQSNHQTCSKWKCYLQHWKWFFPSSWNYLIYTTLNQIILKRKITISLTS